MKSVFEQAQRCTYGILNESGIKLFVCEWRQLARRACEEGVRALVRAALFEGEFSLVVRQEFGGTDAQAFGFKHSNVVHDVRLELFLDSFATGFVADVENLAFWRAVDFVGGVECFRWKVFHADYF